MSDIASNDSQAGVGGARLSRRFRVCEALVLGGLTLWLFYAAAVFGVEYWDGWDSVVSARGLLGDGWYALTRGPLVPVILLPGELLRRAVGASPVAIWPYHLAMSVTHVAYLFAVYAGLIRWFERGWAVLAAFVAAVVCFSWIDQAPYLSHDILSGAFVLWMAILSAEYVIRPTRGAWVWLVLLGAAAALHKHGFAMFWVIVLLVHAVGVARCAVTGRRFHLGTRTRRWLALFAAACLSGVITWLGYAAAHDVVWVPEHGIDHPVNDAPRLLRPYYIYDYYAGVTTTWEGGTTRWGYFRNILAYGPLTVLLLLPALYVAARGTARHRVAAAVFVLVVAYMVMALYYGEVRYMLVATPLAALLIVPPLRWLLARRAGAVLVGVTLVATWMPGWDYAASHRFARVASPFFTTPQLETLFQPARPILEAEPGDPEADTPIVWDGAVTFKPPGPNVITGDQYNDLFGFGAFHFRRLYRLDDRLVVGQIEKLVEWPDNTLLLWMDGGPLTSLRKWDKTLPYGDGQLRQYVARAHSFPLRPATQQPFAATGAVVYQTADGQTLTLRLVAGDKPDSPPQLRIEGSGELFNNSIHLRLHAPGVAPPRPVQRVSETVLVCTAGDLVGAMRAKRPIEIFGFRVLQLHGIFEPGAPGVFIRIEQPEKTQPN